MKNKHDTLTPKLRFPEFEGEPWREVQLEDVTEECTTRNGNTLSSESVMGVTKAEGIIPMKERIIGTDLARYKLVRKDWFAYNPMRLNIGSIARWPGETNVLVSPDYVVFRCLEETDVGIDPEYLDHFRRSDHWDHFVARSGIGSVRVRIYYKDIGRLRLQLPSPAEQRKIAACLTSLDEWLAVEGRKLEALRAHKRALMQQLFPREGENRPRLRFPEFRDQPQWKETRLGQLGKLISGLTYSPADVRSEGLLVLRSSNIQDGEIALEDRVYVRPDIRGVNLAQPNDILICVRNGSKPLIGKNALLPEELPLCTHGAFMTVLRASAPQFVFQLLQTRAYHKQVVADLGATINSINGNQLLKYRFVAPEQDEQQRIAACLSSLDGLIAAQSHKLDGLRTHKKGLMQQLFPSPEDNNDC